MRTERNNFYQIIELKNRSAAIWIERFYGYRPNWEDLTAPNLKAYKGYLLKNISQNSAKTYLAELKAIINLYKSTELIPCQDRELKLLNVKLAKTTNCYLTLEELRRLESLPLTNQRHKDIRDMFLLQSWTGCRESDATNLTLENINDGFLSYMSQKTQIYSSIPVKPLVLEIISRMPEIKQYSRATYNRVISKLCEMAKIDEPLTLFKSGEKISGRKFEFITSHTARRSFATNLYNAGIEITKIAYMMGHSSTSMTERYICSNMEINENILSFFK